MTDIYSQEADAAVKGVSDTMAHFTFRVEERLF